MKTKLVLAVALLSLKVPAAFAHRLDEYLQALIISVEQDRVQVSMRLVPGVAVSPAVIVMVDSNDDGVFSQTERQTYARQVLRDLSLSLDGQSVKPRLLALSFPNAEEMHQGWGEIHLDFAAQLPLGGSRRTLVIEDHHQSGISAYLMNCLLPQNRNLRIVAQNRNTTSRSIESITYSVGIRLIFRLCSGGQTFSRPPAILAGFAACSALACVISRKVRIICYS